MNHDDSTLASSYLDDVVTPDERVRVETSPELLAEVERLRRVRAVVADTDAAPISMRERHLAAALDAWDNLPASERTGDGTPAAASSVSAPTPLAGRRRRRSGSPRLLVAAAALVVVAGAGLVIGNGLGDSDDDEASDAGRVALDAPADSTAGGAAELPADDAGDALETGPMDAADETFDAEIQADGESSAADIALGPVDENDQPAPEIDLEVLGSTADLVLFAGDYLASQERGDDAADAPAATDAPADEDVTFESADTIAPAFDTCGLVDVVVGPAVWNPGGGGEQIVVVGIDQARDDIVAYVEDGCAVVARTDVP